MHRLSTSGHTGHLNESDLNNDLMTSGPTGHIDQGAGASIDGGSRIIRLQ